MKSLYGPQKQNIAPVRSADNLVSFKHKQQILELWVEHFASLSNKRNPSDPSVLDALPDLLPVLSLVEPSKLSEVLSAAWSLKNKSPSPDELPAEIQNRRGYLLI